VTGHPAYITVIQTYIGHHSKGVSLHEGVGGCLKETKYSISSGPDVDRTMALFSALGQLLLAALHKNPLSVRTHKSVFFVRKVSKHEAKRTMEEFSCQIGAKDNAEWFLTG
jgi:hypothetical protein